MRQMGGQTPDSCITLAAVDAVSVATPTCDVMCMYVTLSGSDAEVTKLRKAVAEDRLKMVLRPFMNRFLFQSLIQSPPLQ